MCACLYCKINFSFRSIKDATREALERIRYAVLKLSEGRLDKLRHYVKEGQIDWRDVLIAASFGFSVDADELWDP